MPRRDPRVTIGLPVHNGTPFLSEAIDSLLAQTFGDFELVIADNASTDATQAICTDYAALDKRIRYIRHDRNIGAAKNFNYVFQVSSAPYFKWAAHDDICAPDYLSQTVRALDHKSSAVLSHSRSRGMDEAGRQLPEYSFNLDMGAPSPITRFRDQLLKEHWCLEVFGLMRAHVLRKTPLIAPFSASDNVLLGELALLGPFAEVPEVLFYHRQRSPKRVYPTLRSREGWFDPSREGRIALPWWLHLRGYSSTIQRAPLSTPERVRCLHILAHWMIKYRHGLVDDLEAAFPSFGMFYSTATYPLKTMARAITGIRSMLNGERNPTKPTHIV